jgi:hypothetical protein
MPPSPPTLDVSDPRFELHERVGEAILALPGYFRTKTVIEGLAAQDLFTLNSTLGATIEQQVVQTLNTMREVWDPDGAYKLYRFDRQAQTFPDVRLARRSAGGALDIAFGIELKGWYLLLQGGRAELPLQRQSRLLLAVGSAGGRAVVSRQHPLRQPGRARALHLLGAVGG